MRELLLNKKTLYTALILHTIFFAITISVLYIQYKKSINSTLVEKYETKRKIYNNQLKVLNNYTDLLKSLLINKDILQIMAGVKNDFNASRKKLISKLLPEYRILNRYGVYQLHFHLPGGISFVRFNSLKEYGDELYPFRPSIKYVQTHLSNFHGFETGKRVSGFRNVYPLIYNGKMVGSFEISFSMKKLVQSVFENDYITFVIKKDILEKKLFKDAWKYYQKCKLNGNFYTKAHVCKMFKHKNHHVDFSKKVNIIENILIFSYPLYNIKHQHVGYMISAFPINSIESLKDVKDNYRTLLFIVVLVYIAVLGGIIFIYNYLKMKIKAQYDELTNVLNRAGCMKKVNLSDNYSLLVLDIDHFKKINDTYGHDVGDKVLKEFASLVKHIIRKEDVFCRWGGEEFIVIIPNADEHTSAFVAEKIRKAVEEHHFINDIPVTVSIGVAQKDKNFENTFKKADMKLYRAKESGRNRVVV